MGYYRRWKPSKTRVREFIDTMNEIQKFCDENGIDYSGSMDSYYFTLNGKDYRVSNHTIEASDRGMYKTDVFSGEVVKVRESYHSSDTGEICITASKTRIIDIYNDLKNGYELDRRGYRKIR